MKQLLLIFALSFGAMVYSQESSKLIASCCSGEKGTEARCSGTASCRACSSCRYCGHCNSGGTCGVCSSYAAPPKTKKNYKKVYKQPNEYYENQIVFVTSETLNLRTGAGTEFDILQTLHKYDSLTILGYSGEWLYVAFSGLKGYVHYKYVE